MDRRFTPPKRVTSLTWGPPPPRKQAVIGQVCSLKCGVAHTWWRTLASLNDERFHGHQVKLKWVHFTPSHKVGSKYT